MESKEVSGVMLTLLLLGALTLAFDVQLVEASGTIYIRADGSVDPPTANITSADNVTYYFTDNNYDEIVVERSDIIIDGNGYILQGSGSGVAFYLYSLNNVTIQNANIKNFGEGVLIWLSSNITVSGNNITNNTYYGVRLYLSSNNIISGNNITNNTKNGVDIITSSSNTVSGNNITNNTLIGAFLDRSSSNTVSGNNITNNVHGIRVYSSSSNTVSGNTITNNNVNGVYLSHSSDNTVSGNNITSNENGVTLYFKSYNNTISGNTITNSTYDGIWLSGSPNNTIFGNSITNNNIGIDLVTSSSNTVSGNTITNNVDGIFFYSSSTNTVSGNTITNNDRGAFFYSSPRMPEPSFDNRFFHNNFIDNTQQVNITMSSYANFWDDGYPSGGNYWSDYSGVDLYSGPYQNETGSDRIGDTPYIIDANNTDNYPFMNKDGWGPITIIPDPTGGQKNLTVESNAILTHVVATRNTVHFEVTGPPGQTAYIKVTIPVGLNTTSLKVFVDGVKITPPPFPIITTNGTHYLVYFEVVLSTHTVTMQFWLLGDITGPEGEPDGKVDIRDIATVAKAFGSYPGHPDWNPICDLTGPEYLTPDDKVDIRDIALVAIHFGETV